MHLATSSIAPIGVYDSGVGGLSVLQALQAALPAESFIYVADSRHAPYGDRSATFLEARSAEITSFLQRCQVKALVLACNTISVVAARALRARHSLPIVAMEPAIKPAASATKSQVVLVLATPNTIRSPSVVSLCKEHGARARIILQPCPGLAEQVERRELNSDTTRRLLGQYIRPGLLAGADIIVLGCTHYSFLATEIAKIAGPSVSVMEPSAAIARQLAHRLPQPLRSASPIIGATTFYTSGSTQDLRAFLSVLGKTNADIRNLPGEALTCRSAEHAEAKPLCAG
ncbi:glutamate racemase [Nitrosomonas sp. Is37]|uniref:glutamate racemase n=1 Tax=Nitrosomonas sp. Is37 TaxID=3080535 RepID=UPI003981F2BF